VLTVAPVGIMELKGGRGTSGGRTLVAVNISGVAMSNDLWTIERICNALGDPALSQRVMASAQRELFGEESEARDH
jgi:hypothetical protein